MDSPSWRRSRRVRQPLLRAAAKSGTYPEDLKVLTGMVINRAERGLFRLEELAAALQGKDYAPPDWQTQERAAALATLRAVDPLVAAIHKQAGSPLVAIVN